MSAPQVTSVGGPRRRAIALLLSIGLPGLGELYAGRVEAAFVTFCAIQVLPVLGVAAIFARLPGLAFILVPLGVTLGAWIGVLIRAARAAARAPQPYALQAYNRWYWYLAAVLINLFIWQPALRGLLRARWLEAYRIPSAAMEPTILVGDFIFVSRRPSAHRVERDDLVVFSSSTDRGLTVIKRAVGLPGDTLAMTDGTLVRNGESMSEPFTQSADPVGASEQDLGAGRAWHLAHLVHRSISNSRTYHPNARNWGPLVIPPDSMFVLGDNRDASYDSRYYGAVGLNSVRGKPLAIYFSFGEGGVRWERIGRRF